jgi:hypothetical protein
MAEPPADCNNRDAAGGSENAAIPIKGNPQISD